ncbi:MAG: hypothetical protein Q9160_007833 [Pyrenula sp. 1 TL-2023]
MPKRPRSDEIFTRGPSTKRRRVEITDRLSKLSDELILKILAYLSISSLVKCQRSCHRLDSLAGDSELWKRKFYARWIRPRTRRIPASRGHGSFDNQSHLSSKLVNWLDHGHLLQKDRETDWKRQYKLKHNWSNGTCKVKDIEVKQPPFMPVLVRLHNGVVFTADRDYGLRAWNTKSHNLLTSEKLLLAATSWSTPTSLGIGPASGDSEDVDIAVGFDSGSFRIYTFDSQRFSFTLRYSRPPSSFGSVTAVSPAYPYLAVLFDHKSISIYKFPESESESRVSYRFKDPHLIHSLNTPQRNSPATLSLRAIEDAITIGVAFLSPKLNQTWCVGIQEIHLPTTTPDPVTDPNIQSSPFTPHSPTTSSRLAFSSLKYLSSSTFLFPQDQARNQALNQPLSISYSHPYLLTTNPDNTLEICLVTSDANCLTISDSRRLWGHTSAVSGAEVSNRGRAVSVARRGNEVRLWDLEDLVTSSGGGARTGIGMGMGPKRSSVPIAVESQAPLSLTPSAADSSAQRRKDLGLGLGAALPLADPAATTGTARGYVGFDEEQVVVLREIQPGKQILSCYDFT